MVLRKGCRRGSHDRFSVTGRRGRRNRSASRAQGAANETSVEHHELAASAAGGSAHEAKAPAEPSKKAASEEPIILGVGVPASEL
jgi:ribonuclease E